MLCKSLSLKNKIIQNLIEQAIFFEILSYKDDILNDRGFMHRGRLKYTIGLVAYTYLFDLM